MKSSILNLTTFLVSFQCSKSNIDDLSFGKTLEGLKISNSPLSFSFNKKDYSGVKCNFNDEILTHKSLMKPPFYHSIATSNFFSVFCFIFNIPKLNITKNLKKYLKAYSSAIWKGYTC